MIIGHQVQWQYLKKAFRLNRLSHALLFSGQSKLGKRTLALELAKLLNCQSTDFQKRPCQKCSACLDIEAKKAPDLILISPEKKEISISAIRELKWKTSLKPYQSAWKVAILDDAHTLTKEAQQAFLKTLEEPKEKNIFILITEYPDWLLATIRSRLQLIQFKRVPNVEILKYLKKRKINEELIQKILSFSAGRPGQVIEFLKSPQKLEVFEERIKEIEEILKWDLNKRFQYAKEISELSLNEINQLFEIWIYYFHQLFLNNFKQSKILTNKILLLKHQLEIFEKTQTLINFTNVNIRLALETLFLTLNP